MNFGAMDFARRRTESSARMDAAPGVDDRLRADLEDLKERLRVEAVEKERLKLRCARDHERFAAEYSQFEARLVRANSTLEKNRQLLETALREKDAEIASMQTQVDKQRHVIECLKQDPRLQYSLLRRHNKKVDESDQEDDEDDGRLHALEQQVSKLFSQLHEAERVKEEQAQHIETQKAANTKLMSALKKMKRKAEEAADSGVNHMLQDIQSKYMRLEADKAKVDAALDASRAEIGELQSKLDGAQTQHKVACNEAAQLRDSLKAMEAAKETLEKELDARDLYIRDLETDYKIMGKVDVANPEMEHAQRVLDRKNDELMQMEAKCKQYERQLELQQHAGGSEVDGLEGSSAGTRPLTLTDLDQLHSQAIKVENKAHAVTRMVATFEEGQHRDLQSLLIEESDAGAAVGALSSEQDGKQRILMSLMVSQTLLDDLSHSLGQTFARHIGSNCAMQ
ncbi:Aste57867_25279 [Aphanomyces stellatus]|uniref:Aste57867_25279 protein n=1 Tax=Aphanomyces stellatus TaxID=120398 RepID=A0A485LTE0_9STRA|nr:hypothetical protein As57867_025201 [Aphanomyces stellatus]VFU01905.1 Aste57867_25279 [Aphanomyces stellatus]